MSALIIGWYRSQPKHLQKYCQFYKGLGLKPVVYRYPLWKGLTQMGFNYLAERDLRDIRQKENFQVVHCFSGGLFPYYGMVNSSVGLRHQRLIIDSGPIIPDIAMVRNYLLTITGCPQGLQWLGEIAQLWQLDTFLAYRVYGYQFPDFMSRVIENNTPKLFINSPDDPYLDQKQVHDFIERCQKWAPVQAHWMENSNHCQHLRTNPEQYTSIVKNFLSVKPRL